MTGSTTGRISLLLVLVLILFSIFLFQGHTEFNDYAYARDHNGETGVEGDSADDEEHKGTFLDSCSEWEFAIGFISGRDITEDWELDDYALIIIGIIALIMMVLVTLPCIIEYVVIRFLLKRILIPLIECLEKQTIPFLCAFIRSVPSRLTALWTRIITRCPWVGKLWNKLSGHILFYAIFGSLCKLLDILKWIIGYFLDSTKIIPCSNTVKLTVTETASETEYDLPFGKTGPEVRQDAIDLAEAEAKERVRKKLERTAGTFECAIGCTKHVTYDVRIIGTTKVTSGYRYYTATATAEGTVTIECLP